MLRHLMGIDERRFDATIRGKTYFLARSAYSDASELFGWRQLNDVLDMSDPYSAKISVRKEGEALDSRLFTAPNSLGAPAISPSAIRRSLQDGYSMVLNELHTYSGRVRKLSENLTESLGESVGVNAYVSWKSEKCFTTHWDSHDALIIQTVGAKEWSVFKPTREHPMATDVSFDTDLDQLELCWQGVLTPGDVLYLPRGWWHHAKSTGAGSIHLTAGFRNRRATDLIGYLIAKASLHEQFRADLARPTDSIEYAAEKERLIGDLTAFLAKQLSSDFVDEYWNQSFGELPKRTINNLPTLIDFDLFAATDQSVRFTGLAPQTALEVTGAEFNFCTGERKWHLDMRAYELVSTLLDGRAHSVSQLEQAALGGLSSEETRELVFELANEGVLSLVDG